MFFARPLPLLDRSVRMLPDSGSNNNPLLTERKPCGAAAFRDRPWGGREGRNKQLNWGDDHGGRVNKDLKRSKEKS
jgi:hypothetical protein